MHLKTNLLKATQKTCGISKQGKWHNQTWWWNNSVNYAVNQKRRLFKIWKKGSSKEDYTLAKKVTKQTVFAAKKKAEIQKLNNVENDDITVFCIAKQMKKENKGTVGEKCIQDNSGKLAYSDEQKKKTWKQHYERLLNVEFPWSKEHLSVADPVLGPPTLATRELAEQSVKASSDICSEMIADLTNSIIRGNTMPNEWNDSIIISLYKGKGEALDRGNYRGLKLTEHILKVIEQVIEDLIRNIVKTDDMQFGFVPGRGTTDAIFIVRQIQQAYIRKNRNPYFASIDLEKAFDRVPRKVLWWSLRKAGVPEWIVRVIQVMFQNSRSQVRVNNFLSDRFDVQVGVHQDSVLSPLLFIIVLEALSREFHTSCPWELLYPDDLVLLANTMDELFSKLGNWKTHLEAKVLRQRHCR